METAPYIQPPHRQYKASKGYEQVRGEHSSPDQRPNLQYSFTELSRAARRRLGKTTTRMAKQRQRQRGVWRRDRDLSANCLMHDNGNEGRDEGQGEQMKGPALANGNAQ
eukprot:844730-Pleurochrysis_carterae.AAC.1